ncbi:tumor necrosis factor receptor superfamily member 9 [Colossoma macropomum]|uniref:tumor necrosis factor receptor superfamily member 9 n=1 Tax=Colossoma macropomum TaxID=42526 RepID=UPI00186415B1|nr:tumor necrosis factor receptor superfamily member 9 [Colossoma macropomum]
MLCFPSATMICQTSLLLFSFMWVFVLQDVTVAITCRAGQKVSIDRTQCINCPEGQYRSKPGDSVECLNCRPCGKYSMQIAVCTPISNAQCKCSEGFTNMDKHHEVCRCQPGSGLKNTGNGKEICKPCPPGTFTNKYNSWCEPWKKCDQGGVATAGTNISDVVCKNQATPDETRATTPPSSTVLVPQTSANTSTTASTTTQTSKSIITPSSGPLNGRQHGLWVAVSLGSILAFILIQFVIIKMKMTTCFHKNKKEIVRQDSACTKPVEESGEKFLSV